MACFVSTRAFAISASRSPACVGCKCFAVKIVLCKEGVMFLPEMGNCTPVTTMATAMLSY